MYIYLGSTGLGFGIQRTRSVFSRAHAFGRVLKFVVYPSRPDVFII